MKFLLDIEVEPEDGGEPFTVEQVREHLETYVFAPNVSFEMSLLKDDPDHELGDNTQYRTFAVTSVEVTPVVVTD